MANEWKNEKIKKWKKRKLIDTQKNQRKKINQVEEESVKKKQKCVKMVSCGTKKMKKFAGKN